MGRGLNLDIISGWEPLSKPDWERLFPGIPDCSQEIAWISRCSLEGVTLHTMIVRHDHEILLYIPLYESTGHWDSLLKPGPARLMNGLERIPLNTCQSLASPTCLGIGFLDESGVPSGPGIGFYLPIDDAENSDILKGARKMVLDALHSFIRVRGVNLVAEHHALANTKQSLLTPLFHQESSIFVSTPSTASISLPYRSLEEYFQTLSLRTQQELARLWQARQSIEVIRTHTIEPWLESLDSLYMESLPQSPLVSAVLPHEYFKGVGRQVNGASFVLYLFEKQLVGFELQKREGNTLKTAVQGFAFSGWDEKRGPLALIAWLETIHYCIENGIPSLHAHGLLGQTHSRLGVSSIPGGVTIKHVKPWLHRRLHACMNLSINPVDGGLHSMAAVLPSSEFNSLLPDDVTRETLASPPESKASVSGYRNANHSEARTETGIVEPVHSAGESGFTLSDG